MVRSIIDKAVSSWYDFLNDFVELNGKTCDIFDLVSLESEHTGITKVSAVICIQNIMVSLVTLE